MEAIQHHFDGKKGCFYYEREGARLAEMVYVMAGEQKLIIEHTEVDDILRGQGMGLQLLEGLVKHVRANSIKVIPLCPFSNAMLKRHKEWQDIL